ncbi:uncharacterized protein L969DRAFT_407406 [Mixia osmundae IAM 14324]|uniref:Protein kinase domain-containing protein n=1 Tax=Mixia osmundae (strain CBS 9802 / IAM 14324 / JCM 22182 / KY 12970) TaxID=764103 RepID=G7E8R4_MIXOS|nr:uncharacterized protein L969DRAFT_407406 [Mixia osmundae IAM 14324]KEI40168.1 hypothetical protein L969DRAFT_407406 [Mixia osmundae IAM 14324]GAA99532.1 hypothetical protein E5Q_06233 [Mixia osmundae IAM 14324]
MTSDLVSSASATPPHLVHPAVTTSEQAHADTVAATLLTSLQIDQRPPQSLAQADVPHGSPCRQREEQPVASSSTHKQSIAASPNRRVTRDRIQPVTTSKSSKTFIRSISHTQSADDRRSSSRDSTQSTSRWPIATSSTLFTQPLLQTFPSSPAWDREHRRRRTLRVSVPAARELAFPDGHTPLRPYCFVTYAQQEGAGPDCITHSTFKRYYEWQHDESFDIVHETRANRIVRIQVRDRGATDELIGMAELDATHHVDQWVGLRTRDPHHKLGEIYVKMESDESESSRRLCADDFDILRRIGEGSFGQVYRVRKRDSGRMYAMKVLSKDSIAASKSIEHVLAERKVLQRTIDSPFLVGLKFSFQSESQLFFIMDYKAGGELFRYLAQEGGRFTEERVRFYAGEILLALEYLHNRSICYRDLKPENILLDASGHLSLCDFGLSKPDIAPGELTRTFCGTADYLAPEMLLDERGYSRSVDFYAFGVFVHEALLGYTPFYAESRMQKYELIMACELKLPARAGLSAEATDLLHSLITRDPADRLGSITGAADIKKHAFFETTNWSDLAALRVVPPFRPPPDDSDRDCPRRRSPPRHLAAKHSQVSLSTSASALTPSERSETQASSFAMQSRRSSCGESSAPTSTDISGDKTEYFSDCAACDNPANVWRNFTFSHGRDSSVSTHGLPSWIARCRSNSRTAAEAPPSIEDDKRTSPTASPVRRSASLRRFGSNMSSPISMTAINLSPSPPRTTLQLSR